MSAFLTTLGAWDRRVSRSLIGWSPPRPLAGLLKASSTFGEGWMWLLGVLALSAAPRPARALTGAVATLAAVNALVVALKIAVRRVRPRPHRENRFLAASVGAPAADRFSFPSGHAANALSLAVVLAHAFPVATAPLSALALLVGASRVPLGHHYPADMLAGAAVGLTMGTAIAFLGP